MTKRFFRHKVVKFVLWFHLGILTMAIIMFFYLRHTTRADYNYAIGHRPYDAIIVPGYPYHGSWHNIMKTRVYWSKYLWEQGYVKNIIYSGSAVYSPYIESIIMKQYALKMGIPEQLIFTETQAEHSTENLFYSYQIAKANNFENVALATDPVQSFFLKPYANNFNIDYLPIQYNILEQVGMPDIKIDPAVAFQEDFIALPERENIWQRLNGTLGNNIIYENFE